MPDSQQDIFIKRTEKLVELPQPEYLPWANMWAYFGVALYIGKEYWGTIPFANKIDCEAYINSCRKNSCNSTKLTEGDQYGITR